MKTKIIGLFLLVVLLGVGSLACAAEDKVTMVDGQMVISEINQALAQRRDFYTQIETQWFKKPFPDKVQMFVYTKSPNSFYVKVVTEENSLITNSETFSNGSEFWKTFKDDKENITEAFKYSLEYSEFVMKAMVDSEKFKQIVENSTVIEAKEIISQKEQIYWISFKVKEEVRQQQKDDFKEILELDEEAVEKIIADKMNVSWEKNNKYFLKDEAFNVAGELIFRSLHKDSNVDQGLEDKLFSYIPPEGVVVQDLTK